MGAAMIGGAAVAFGETGASDGSSPGNSSANSANSDGTRTSGSDDSKAPSSTSKSDVDGGVDSKRDAVEHPVAKDGKDDSPGDATGTPGADDATENTDGDTDSNVDTPEATRDAPDEDVTPSVGTPATATSSTTPASEDTDADPEDIAADAPLTPAVVTPAPAIVEPAGTHGSTTETGTAAVGLVNPNVVATAATPKSLVSKAALPTPNQVGLSLQRFGQNIAQTLTNQVLGVQRNLADLSADLARIFGIREVVITDPAPYGNLTANTQYWATRNFVTAALVTVAMAYGQLTGTTPDVQDFIDLALTTNSLTRDNEKIYQGVGVNRVVLWTDSYELLQGRGVRIITNYYASGQQSEALNALATGLQNPNKAMIVSMNGQADGVTGVTSKTVVVLGVNTDTRVVTLNDPTLANGGQGMTMNLDDFLSAWGAQNYALVTAALNATAGATTPPPPVKTKLVWTLPAPQDLGKVLQDLAGNIALAVVHQVQGVGTNLSDLGADLARTFGVSEAPTFDPPSANDVEFGNYAANKPYWIFQGTYPTCALMATAGVIGQLTGTMPTQQEIIALATSTPSDKIAGEMIYEGDGKNGKHYGTYTVDVVKMLNLNGINAEFTTYLKSQGQLALDSMTSALGQNQGVIVSVNNNVVYNAYTSTYFGYSPYKVGTGILSSNHAVIVISVDLSKNVVYLNDSAFKNGQGLPVPLDKFMDAWQTSGYSLTTAQLAAATAPLAAAA